jgi:oxygen-independent coproporphyrinogen-3 oxidase
VKEKYGEAMMEEIKSAAGDMKDTCVSTIFLGGGTPSVMPAGVMRRIFSVLYDCFDISDHAEITMEMNPGTLQEENLSFVSDCVNRVSLGVQSFQDKELKLLGRIHNREQAIRSVELLKEAGIRNINIDLMSAIPSQTLSSWKDTLNTALDLEIPHISAYSLIIEEGTPFAKMKREDLNLPDEDTEREMYYETKRILNRAGFSRYEISNYARPGFACRHNVRYWKRGEYLGLGIGAASFFHHKRWKNTDSLEEYLKDSKSPALLVRNPENLSQKSEMEEFMFLGLRMMEGITAEDFQRAFQEDLREVYGKVLDQEISEGLMEREGTRYFLTDRGIDVSNWVLSDFLFDS